MNNEIIKGKSDNNIIVILVIGIVLLFPIGAISKSTNSIATIVIICLLAIGIIYFLLGDLYNYTFYDDRIEIHYPFRKSKNLTIFKEQIKVGRYEAHSKVTKITLFYEVNSVKLKRVLRLKGEFEYIYNSIEYKALCRLRDWNVKLDLRTRSKELNSILKK